MKAPSVRSLGVLVSTTSETLKLTPGANWPGDLAVIYVKGSRATAITNAAYTPHAPGYADVYRSITGNTFEVVMWAKVPEGGLGKEVLVYGEPEVGIKTTPWWGHVDVISGAGYPTWGWLDVPGTVGNYGSYSRSVYSSGTFATLDISVRVRLGTTGIVQSFAGWGAGDMRIGLGSDDKMIAYVVNTVAANIGNAASTVALPLPGSRPIWLRAVITRATGGIAYYYSLADVADAAAVPGSWVALGTPVVGTGAGTTVRTTNSGTVLLGTHIASAAAFNGDVLGFSEDANGVTTTINFSDAGTGVVEVGTADVIRPTTQDGVDSPIERWSPPNTVIDPTDLSIPVIPVYTAGSLILHTFTLERAGAEAAWVDSGTTYHQYGDRTTIAMNTYVRHQAFSKTADATVAAEAAYLVDQNTTVDYYYIVVRGRTDVVRPPFRPQPPRVTLGCADSYTLFITDQTYERTIEQLGWSKLRWERTLDDISKASATIPDRYGGVACLAQVGGMVPWAYGIKIERNDQEVWRGPVTNVSRNGDDIQVDAADVLCRYQKRFVGRGLTVEYNEVDAGHLFYKVLTSHAALASDAWNLPAPDVKTGVSITRALHPRELKYAWDLLSELLDTAVDAYVMNGRLYVWEPGAGWQYQNVSKRTFDGPYNVNYDLVYGTFTEEAWSERPNWSMDGPGQANYVVVPGVDSSEFGFRRLAVVENTVSQTRYGVLDYVDQNRIELPEDVNVKIEAAAMTRRAETLIALRSFAPAVISGGALSDQAPIDMENLRPGSLWKMDVWDHGFGQLLAAGRMSKISVDVTVSQTGIKEVVVPTLMPPGWEEE